MPIRQGKKVGHVPKILLVEDIPYLSIRIVERIAVLATVICASACCEVKGLIRENPDIDVIIMDNQLDDGSSFDLVVSLRAGGCTIPIVTSSSSERGNFVLMKAGCTHQSNKDHSWRVALEILGINPNS